MLPAWVGGGCTVVVVPLLALRGDLRQRCAQAGISCVEWEGRTPADGCSIVLVTPESVFTQDFQNFLNRQIISQRLDRVVIDECHIVLNERSDFRPTMQRLGELVKTARRSRGWPN
jgi:superfamily II DNA helicase RecQ